MAVKLTKAQDNVLDTLKNYIDKFGQSPTLGELQHLLNIGTKRGVVSHLKALEKKGFITRISEARGISLANLSSENIITTPILGYANAGRPLAYVQEQQVGTLRIDRSLLPITKEIFAVVVKGDSMNRKKVNGVLLEDGNYAIVAKNQDIKQGDPILAIIDNCATIKSIKFDKKIITLYPESANPIHQPIYLSSDNDAMIAGKVIAVLDNPMTSRIL